MKPKEIKVDVGIIVGRFQVPSLHEAHVDLIQSVLDRHPKVVIFLGLSPCKTTYNNPLDFEARKQLILQKFPDINVLYIKDEARDDVWSQKLDSQIEDVLGPNQSAVLYGSRDSFIPFYTTKKFPVIELEPDSYISGTEIRKEVSNKVKASPDFRAGVIWAVGNQYPSCLPTVDVAIVDRDKGRILLARKSGQKAYRFVGGFASTKSHTYEEDARREVMEETGLDVSEPIYSFSCIIDDWRYRREANKIKTLFFICDYVSGCPTASDDISEVRWFEFGKVELEDIVEEHRELMEKFDDKMGQVVLTPPY